MLHIDPAEAAIPDAVTGPCGAEHADCHSLRHSYLAARQERGGHPFGLY